MMKLNVLFVLAALQLANVEARAPPKFRRSLSFGPTLTHSRFETLLQPAHFSPSREAERPLDVAREHLTQLYPPTEQVSWHIRPDSYTDARTGVTHVYAVQRVNGLPVADGVINLNIQNGRVISIGDSFYTGAFPHDSPVGLSGDALSSTQLAFCDQIAANPEPAQASPQMPMISEHGSHGIHPSLADVEQHNCGRLNLAQQLSHLSDDHYTGDARAAALSFMIHATHDQEVAEGIANRFDSHYKQLRVTAVHSVTGHPEQHIDGVPGVEGPVKAYPAYIQTPTADGTSSELNLVWKLEVKMADNWYDAAVSAVNPAIIFSVADWVSDSPYYPQPEGPSNVAVSTRLPTSRLGRPVIVPFTDHKLSKGGPHTYNVFPWGINDPSEGKRAVLKPQFDALASPAGWHSINSANDPSRLQGRAAPVPPVYINYTTTFGNNVFAQENWEGRSSWLDNYRPISTTKWPTLTFDYPYNPKAADDGLAEAQQWINNTITQLFYTSNMIHDIFYRYGFDEVSGNFQQYNFGRGGQENDAVIANAQDGSGYNNANFATPPDGSNGRCRMYLWNTAAPYRDGDLEAGIVIHEFAHGLSTRLTGGPSDSSCLAFGEGGGMGEGWGDFLATMIRANEEYSDYPMGSWAANMEKGIRNYPYSLDFAINPSTYKTLDKPGYWGVHAIGEVWAEILWVIAQKFIAKHGFSETLFPPPVDPATGLVPENNDFYRPRANANAPLVPKHGNTLIVQLVLNGMKLQPCRPGFFEARDAIIQADEILTGGENLCELWEGFGERGLGPDATVVGKTPWGGGIRKDDFSVPQACRKEKKKPKKLWF